LLGTRGAYFANPSADTGRDAWYRAAIAELAVDRVAPATGALGELNRNRLLALIDRVRAEVLRVHGLPLELEVKLLGEDP
jgi:hypothetical protein